jgi:hypothetical protein
MSLRFLLLLMLLLGFVRPCLAADAANRYQPTNFRELTAFASSFGIYNFDDNNILLEYLQATDCDLYKTVKDSTFKLEELRQTLKQQGKQTHPANEVIQVQVPAVFQVSGYNFDTQSITILPDLQLKNVNTFDILNERITLCDNISNYNLSYIPAYFSLRSNFPISLRRIPMHRHLAEALFPKLDRLDFNNQIYLIYATIYVTIEPITPFLEDYRKSIRAVMRGQIDMIDLFADRERKALIKRLNYADNY